MFWFKLNKFRQIICEPLFIQAMIKGCVAGVEHRYLLQNLKFDCLVDVGANRGQFALIFHKLFPQASIHSFEPLEEPAQIFKRIFSNDPNVKLYTCAIGREKTTATIHITKDDDSSSMLPITKMQTSMFPGSIEKEKRQVTILPLSQALGSAPIPPATLLKIDVQGFELDVLLGCEDILNRFSHLYIECSFVELYEGQALAHRIIAWLEQRNFVISGVHNLYYDAAGRAVQGDFLFTHISRVDDY
jgi:FkbM family methyltransferase